MKKALLLIDYIHDFVDDDGALTIGKPAQYIRENIIRAISRLGKGDLLVLANDCHNWQQPHPEKKLFPPHALAGTAGCQTTIPEAVKNAKAPVIIIKKRHFSAFEGTGLVDMLKAAGIEKLYIAGVSTNICVLHSAIAAYNLGLESAVLEDCVAAFDAPSHDFAMKHFRNVLGFEITNSQTI